MYVCIYMNIVLEEKDYFSVFLHVGKGFIFMSH